jgi:hypothetical protein
MDLFGSTLWMIPFVLLALAALYVGYLAYQADVARRDHVASVAAAVAAAGGADPIAELERVNTELARAVTSARVTLDQARDAIARGTR